MKPEYYIVNAKPEHAIAIAPHLRAKDVEDVEAMFGGSALDGLLWALSLSRLAWAGIDSEGVIAIWGVGSLSVLSETGQPWLVGTDRLVKKYRKPFLRMVDLFLDLIVEEYPTLEGYQRTKEPERLRWLEWCGFKLDKPVGQFARFELRRGERTCLT